MNAFVHVSLPDEILVDIEENKITCNDCGKAYYTHNIHDNENGIHIDSYLPHDGKCGSCGSADFKKGSDPIKFEKDLE